MKTYTFKIKFQFPKDEHPVILSVVHCPLEVLFDSLKEIKQFDELYNKTIEGTSDNAPYMYITASDYTIDNNTDYSSYVSKDFVLCKYKAVIDSKSLTEFLTHCDYYGFVEDFETAKYEIDLKLEAKNNEV